MPLSTPETRYGGAPDALACPNCLQENLHHNKVHVYSRAAEDGPGVHAITEEGAVHVVDTDMRKNPSRRRDGIRIEFWCEHCDCKPVLELRQHKGSTFISWAE